MLSSVAQSFLTLCNPIDCSMPGFPVHHQLLELAQTHVHWVADAIQPSHPLLFLSPPAFNLSQHQGLFQWVISSHQVAKAEASASVLPMNIQDWFPLGLTCLIFLLLSHKEDKILPFLAMWMNLEGTVIKSGGERQTQYNSFICGI